MMKKLNITYFSLFFLMVLLLFSLPSFASDSIFKQYYLISSRNLLGQERIIKLAVSSVNTYLNNKGNNAEEAVSQLNDCEKKLVKSSNELNSVAITESLKKLHDVNLRVTNNNLKTVSVLNGMLKENYNFDYATDYIKILKKFEEITKLSYHGKDALISAQSDAIEENKNNLPANEKVFFEYRNDILKIQKDFIRISFDVNFYSLEYLSKEIEKYELRIIVQENIDKTKQCLLRCEAIKAEGRITELHKILYGGILENYLALKEFGGYLADEKSISMNDIQKHLARVGEILENYESLEINYLETI